MRQTTEYQSYAGSEGVSPSHGLSPASHSPDHRSGFTLIEVMIALVIIGLAGLGLATFSMQSYRATQDLTIRATAENLAEVTLEELRSLAGSTLYDMTHSPSGIIDINFPENGYVEPAQEAQDAAAKYNNSSIFNSGTKKFNITDGTYHVLCNGQLLLGTYSSFFDGAGTVGSVGGSGAVVKTSDGTTDLFNSSPWSSVVTVTGPTANDYYTIYTPSQEEFLSSLYSDYSVYKYGLASGIYLEPINSGTTTTATWQTAGLLVFASTAPHLYREVTITDDTTVSATPSSARMYRISVRVIWTFGGVRQVVEVTGAKTDIF
jgi:prepilin-type N-terminal cleavage/methylation domain-containing protein